MAKGYLYDNGDELISREDALPDTASASQGDVLSLDSEKKPVWSAPSAPSGGGLVISVDLQAEEVVLGGGYTGRPTNKTWGDVKNALEHGIIPIVYIPSGDRIIPTYVLWATANSEVEGYSYGASMYEGNAISTESTQKLLASSENSVMYFAYAQV